MKISVAKVSIGEENVIYSSMYIDIMSLQPFVGRWLLFQFLNLYAVDRTLLAGDQLDARPLPAHSTNTE
jgi:hypothetical protein